MIRSLLVANRGEIARRIFRTCRQMGIGTVAVFSDPDRTAPFVGEADQAIALGGASPSESYLRVDAVIDAARRAGADAVHPGYGFLAENAAFARAVIEAGLTWVGPPPEAIEAMGSKLRSKALITAAGVPTLPSVDLSALPDEDILEAATGFGFPVLVKASAGGGGKGMRIVHRRDDLLEAARSAEREAASAFGDGTVFVERYLDAPRHIEIQVFGDTHGNMVSLFERECSIQRRHQKIIEESPSPVVDADLRERMGRAAVEAAKAVGYVGAGTVEFLFQNGEFYFLEMNTRLQVEHPVTEEITGLDLVRIQLRVAAGAALPEEALEPVMVGHAIEARLYAEDARNQYLPVTGDLHRFRFPELVGLRVDSGVEDGSMISVHYDPMLAKVIAWAETRQEATSLLASALERAQIHGSITNRDLLVRILRHPEFEAGTIDTHFLERHDPKRLAEPLPSPADEKLAAVAAALASQSERRATTAALSAAPSGWRNVPAQLQEFLFTGDHTDVRIGYRFEKSGSLTVHVDNDPLEAVELVRCTPSEVGLSVAGHLRWYDVHRVDSTHYVDGPSGPTRLIEHPRFPSTLLEHDPGSLHAPMPGKVIEVRVVEGDTVAEGEVLVVLEAMKMEHTLRAPFGGTVRMVHALPGDQVDAGTTLVLVEERAT